MHMFPECLCKPGGPSVLTQRAMSLGDALTPAKDHDPQHQVGRRVAYQPQERAIGSQRSQREPLKHGLAQSLDPWREWEEPRDRRHPARHAVHGEEHPAEDEYDRLEQLLEYLQALEARRQPTRMREYPTLPTTSMSSGSRAAHRSGIVTDTTRLIKRSSRITVRAASTTDATTRPTVNSHGGNGLRYICSRVPLCISPSSPQKSRFVCMWKKMYPTKPSRIGARRSCWKVPLPTAKLITRKKIPNRISSRNEPSLPRQRSIRPLEISLPMTVAAARMSRLISPWGGGSIL